MKRWLIRFEIAIDLIGVALLAAAVVIVFFLFPGINNLWTTICVLLGSTILALGNLIAVIRDREDRTP